MTYRRGPAAQPRGRPRQEPPEEEHGRVPRGGLADEPGGEGGGDEEEGRAAAQPLAQEAAEDARGDHRQGGKAREPWISQKKIIKKARNEIGIANFELRRKRGFFCSVDG